MALKCDNIDISMGRGGTDVCREMGDMILMDDNFSSITRWKKISCPPEVNQVITGKWMVLNLTLLFVVLLGDVIL